MAIQLRSKQGKMDDEQAMVERWQTRQGHLADLLEACGANKGERHIEWLSGEIEWVNPAGERVALASMKALCSYAYEERSLMMAWANVGLDEGAVIRPIPDYPAFVEPCEEVEAWLWAMKLADECQADYLYRVASRDYLVFLGLWGVETTISAEEVEAGSPYAFVLNVIEGVEAALQERHREAEALSRLLVNQGESLLQSAHYLYNDRSDGGLLRRTGNTLIEMGSSFGQRRFGLLPAPALSEGEREQFAMQLARLRAQWIQAGKQYKAEGAFKK